jgi:hypothetical protein
MYREIYAFMLSSLSRAVTGFTTIATIVISIMIESAGASIATLNESSTSIDALQITSLYNII